VRTWTSVSDFVQEVAVARIYDGVHYRTSAEVGTAMGKKIGEARGEELPQADPLTGGRRRDAYPS
jgi:hypothetical protein